MEDFKQIHDLIWVKASLQLHGEWIAGEQVGVQGNQFGADRWWLSEVGEKITDLANAFIGNL